MSKKSRFNLPPIKPGGKTIGQHIAQLRKEKGITQIQLAEKIGIIQALISDYERDNIRLNADMVVRFASALEVSTDALLGVTLVQHSPALSLKLVRRMQKIESLPPAQQKTLLSTIDTFLTGAEHR